MNLSSSKSNALSASTVCRSEYREIVAEAIGVGVIRGLLICAVGVLVWSLLVGVLVA